MKTRILRDIEVSAVGMGCMAFSHGYGKIPSEEYSIEAIQNAYRHGCNFFDTAEVYSPNLSGIGHNELIVGKALEDVRNWVPQLSRRNIESNMPIVELLRKFANNKKVLTAEAVRTHCF